MFNSDYSITAPNQSPLKKLKTWAEWANTAFWDTFDVRADCADARFGLLRNHYLRSILTRIGQNDQNSVKSQAIVAFRYAENLQRMTSRFRTDPTPVTPV